MEKLLEIEQQAAVNDLLRRELELVRENGILFYKPHPKQDAFHRAGEKTYRMVRAGNRFGKSQMGGAEDVAWILGERPWYDRSDPARYAGIPQHFVKLAVVCETWQKVEEVFTGPDGKIWQLLPSHAVKKKEKNQVGVTYRVQTERGMITFMTVQGFKKDPMSMESSDWDAVHFDEPLPEAMYKALHRGLMDRNGKCWFTLTPLAEMWINDKFFPHHTLLVRESEEKKEHRNKHWAIEGLTMDNPFLTAESIKNFENELTDEEKQCRLYGKPLALTGLVYKEFSTDKHVLLDINQEPVVPYGWENLFTPPKNYTISFAIDSHDAIPQAVLFIATSPFGQQFIYDEIWQLCTVDVLADEILRRIQGYQVHLRKCDPRAWIRDPIRGGCLAEELMSYGCWVEESSKALSYGIQCVRKALLQPKHVFVNPHLNRFLFEINRYVYKDNKPIDKDDHMMENLYRLLIDEPKWINPEEIYDHEVARRPIGRNLALRRI